MQKFIQLYLSRSLCLDGSNNVALGFWYIVKPGFTQRTGSRTGKYSSNYKPSDRAMLPLRCTLTWPWSSKTPLILLNAKTYLRTFSFTIIGNLATSCSEFSDQWSRPTIAEMTICVDESQWPLLMSEDAQPYSSDVACALKSDKGIKHKLA